MVAGDRPAADPLSDASPAADPAAGPAGPAPAPPGIEAEPTPPLKSLRVRPREDTAGNTGNAGTPQNPSTGGSAGAPAGAAGPEGQVVRLTNAERAKAGCPALRVDARLTTSARRHSADMKARNYFSHTSPNGTDFAARIRAAGYPSPGAENIAMGYPTPAAVMKGWMNSPGHRANILNCKLRAIGTGVATGGRGPYWTQNFGWQ
ncbi:CAP domain-containing protein [Actinomadura craniellae]|uniref:CAP domain-containing protein n=1 Tax=Actinomadura craniellae TaxID=2231787 RepID=A0A365H8L1_9ACTN|nr:CAP domain-containing protein [Actinomadura craniellae]